MIEKNKSYILFILFNSIILYGLSNIILPLPAHGLYEDPVAYIKQFHKNVKSKKASEIGWENVEQNMDIYEGGRIKTMKDSSAIVSYNDLTHLIIKENSLIVIKKSTTREKIKKADIELTKGAVSGKVKSNAGEHIILEISAKSGNKTANIWIDSKENVGKTSKVDININQQNDIFIHVPKGQAKVKSAGKTLTLTENQTTVVEPGEPPAEPWMGLKRPIAIILKACITFLTVFIIISAIILVMNKRR